MAESTPKHPLSSLSFPKKDNRCGLYGRQPMVHKPRQGGLSPAMYPKDFPRLLVSPGMGAWAAEATMFGGALLGRWLPLLARARRVRGTLGRRGGRPAPGGGSGGAGSKLSLMLATVMLLIPADVLKALMGAALLAYGGWGRKPCTQ